MKSSVAKLLGLGAIIAAIPVFALAQQATTAPAAAPVAAPAGSGAPLSPKDQLTAADATLARMKNSATAIRRQLEQARREKDVVKVLCLDDKLSQSDVAVRSAEERRGALESAATKNDMEASSHETTVLAVLAQRSSQVSAEANQCIGEEAAFTNSEQAVTKIDPNISRTENGGMPGPVMGDLGVTMDPPQCTSCAR
jgi:hypothetical protein